MNVKISLLCCFLFAAAIAIALIGCDQDDGSSADDSADDDGWSDDGCEYVFTGTKVSSEGKGLDECIPDNWPEGFDQEPVLAILESYLGTYVDEGDAQRTITCRPEGIWSLPDHDPVPDELCTYSWEIPIWVTFDEEDATVEGSVSQSYLKELAELEPSSWPMADMYFAKDENEYRANRQLGINDIVWIFEMPEGWGVWTKVD